jgi:hypothetical protein
MTLRSLGAAVMIVFLLITSADARGRGYVCGAVQRAWFCKHQGICLPKEFNYSLKWADLTPAFPDVGVVVVQRRKGKASDGKLPGGHVSRIVQKLSDCTAKVADEAGTYERDICANLVAYVRP